jgi:hypothetical protein
MGQLCIYFDKNGLGHILGDFFSQAHPGHPGSEQQTQRDPKKGEAVFLLKNKTWGVKKQGRTNGQPSAEEERTGGGNNGDFVFSPTSDKKAETALL